MGTGRRRAEQAIAVLAFVVGAALRPDAAVALVVLGAIFVVLERLFPLRPQSILRPGLATDAVHFLADEVMAAALLAAFLLVVLPTTGAVVPDVVPAAVRRLPRWLFYLVGLVLAEIAGYWGHRATHEIPLLWRFHKLHHSAPVLDWLAPNRRHPVDMAIARASVILPLAALGFAVPTIAAHFAVKRFQGLLVHANIRLDAGPFTWLVATPEFHHWHHADDPAAYDKNYAGQVPMVDWLFGTLYLPRPSWPSRYGCGEEAPVGYLAQLAWPFRPAPPPGSPPEPDSALRRGTGDRLPTT